MTPKQRVGLGGENAATSYAIAHGMRILYRNWRYGSLELDIICEDIDGVIFVEVKTRKAQSMTSPLEGITAKKCSSLRKAARIWLANHANYYDKPCRFAVAAVSYVEQPILTYKVMWYDNAFDFSYTGNGAYSTVGGCNSSWQPW